MTVRGLLAAFLTALPAIAAAGPTPVHDYVLHCAGCHKLDGSGSARVPALADVGRLLERPGGRAYLLSVPGVAQAPLDDARLAALMNWVVGRFGDQPPTPPFTAAEAGRRRESPLLDPVRARACLFEEPPCRDPGSVSLTRGAPGE
jgi:hypothetical protein